MHLSRSTIGAIHKRRTHAKGGGGFAKSVRKVYKGGGGIFELCTYTFLKTRSYKYWVIFEGKHANIMKK